MMGSSPAKQKVHGGGYNDPNDPKEAQREKERADSLRMKEVGKTIGKAAIKGARSLGKTEGEFPVPTWASEFKGGETSETSKSPAKQKNKRIARRVEKGDKLMNEARELKTMGKARTEGGAWTGAWRESGIDVQPMQPMHMKPEFSHPDASPKEHRKMNRKINKEVRKHNRTATPSYTRYTDINPEQALPSHAVDYQITEDDKKQGQKDLKKADRKAKRGGRKYKRAGLVEQPGGREGVLITKDKKKWIEDLDKKSDSPAKQKAKTEYTGRGRHSDEIGVADYKKGFYEKQGKKGTKGTAVTVIEGQDKARLERYGVGRKKHSDKEISAKRAKRIMRRKGKSHKESLD